MIGTTLHNMTILLVTMLNSNYNKTIKKYWKHEEKTMRVIILRSHLPDMELLKASILDGGLSRCDIRTGS